MIQLMLEILSKYKERLIIAFHSFRSNFLFVCGRGTDSALFVKMSNRMINIKFRVETLAHAPNNEKVIILFKCE